MPQGRCLTLECADAHVIVHLLLQVGSLRHSFGLGTQGLAVQRAQIRQVYGRVCGVIAQPGYGACPPIRVAEQQLLQIGQICQMPHLQTRMSALTAGHTF